jgi:hypothetical protein
MFLLTLFLLLWPLAADRPEITLQCRGKGDLHKLLYTICEHDLICRFLYSLESRASKFHHQLSIFELFSEDENETLMWRGEWRPLFHILYNHTGPSCHEVPLNISGNVTDILSLERSLFHFYALERMCTHKEYISRHRCAHRNERLLFDRVAGNFHCLCPEGKSCEDSDGLHEDVLTLLHCLLLGIFVVVFGAVIYVSVRLLKQ